MGKYGGRDKAKISNLENHFNVISFFPLHWGTVGCDGEVLEIGRTNMSGIVYFIRYILTY